MSGRTLLAAALLLLCACKPTPTRQEGGGGGGEHAGHSAGSMPTGYAPVALDPAKLGALSLATSPVEEQDFARTVRTTGVVAVDETHTTHVHAKVRGVVEAVRVDFVGREVRQGEALCTIYSQEVFGAELELLSVLDRAGSPPPTGEFAEAEGKAHARLVAAARLRLSAWDVPASEIARLESSKEARRTFPLVAAHKGVVVAKQAVAGTFIDPSVELYTISDLATVWLLTDVYEADARFVKVGQAAKVTLQGEAAPIDAVVAFVPPTIDEATRTLKVRIDLPNKERRLRPGAFADVAMSMDLDRGLGVPESAVIRTGTRSIVFVVHQQVHAVPREVVLGPLVNGRYRVLSGVAPGEAVATSAQFLLDSESRLRATTADVDGGAVGGGGHAGHGH